MRHTLFRRLKRKVRNLPSELALHAINVGFVERQLRAGYEGHRRRHEYLLPALRPGDARIVDGLRRDGVFVTSLAELGLDGAQDPIDAVRTIASDFVARKQAGAYDGWETVMAAPGRYRQPPCPVCLGVAAAADRYRRTLSRASCGL